MARMLPRPSLLAAIFAAAVGSAWPAHGGPLLTKAQIEKASQKIDACLEKEEQVSTVSSRKCIGLIRDECDDAISAGGDASHATCSDNETAAWDILLNKAWSDMPESIGAQRFAVLKGIQKSWLSYRDAKCAFLDDPKSPGGWGLMLAADCRMDETARRTIELRNILHDPNFAPE